MKKWILVVSIGTVLVSVQCAAQSTLEQIWQKARTTRAGSTRLSNDKIVAGLKEALTVSTRNAVASTGRPDGFLKNEAIKILVPDRLRSVAQGMRLVGMGGQVDALEIGMNRAAEQAAPAAKQIFINAIKQMTFADARQILSSNDTAATDYFKQQSSDQLREAFAPLVHQAMENVGVIRRYNQIMNNPMAVRVARAENFNLDDYVVGKTTDGLFYVMAEEERKIRKDPMAQTTALLKEVFGKKQ
ncbi:MAG: DUF4197 domain-containing protein [Acidobacteria bacterium]|nr:MAG: DUF4197 domain-containing protein [Acidobacteriota bacterium]